MFPASTPVNLGTPYTSLCSTFMRLVTDMDGQYITSASFETIIGNETRRMLSDHNNSCIEVTAMHRFGDQNYDVIGYRIAAYADYNGGQPVDLVTVTDIEVK